MGITYGFYNSVGGDRQYNASQMSSIFNGIINDGVFMSIGSKLMVSPAGGMSVKVGTGRAWFNSTWTNNDSDIVLTVDQSELILDRIDLVVLEVNSTDEVRANSIKVIKGAPSSTPSAPELVKSALINQYPLCHIHVSGGALSVTQANITNKVGTSECPFITGILSTMNIDALVAQWAGQFSEWLSNADLTRQQKEIEVNAWIEDLKAVMNLTRQQQEEEFEAWFANLVLVLDENVAANLLNKINVLESTTVKKGNVTWNDLSGT